MAAPGLSGGIGSVTLSATMAGDAERHSRVGRGPPTPAKHLGEGKLNRHGPSIPDSMKKKPEANLRRRLKRKARVGRQCAALPVRHEIAGGIGVLLVTSRDTGRWVIPKGWNAPKLSPAQAAAREAYEEAGVVGQIVGDLPIGSYRYLKRLTPKLAVPCEVEVFLLEVETQLDDWPEKRQRHARWFTPDEAATRVDEAELSSLIRGLEAER